MKGIEVSLDTVKTEEELNISLLKIEQTGLIDSKYFNGNYIPVVKEYLKGTDIVLTNEETKIVTDSIIKKARGLIDSVPMTCAENCFFASNCPFVKIGKQPVGKSCLVETMLLDLQTKRYLDEFGVMVDSYSETVTMTMLAATHVMEMRALKVLGESENSTGLISNVVGFNEDEEPIVQLMEHPAYGILERAWRWRDKLLTSLVGTRKEKYRREAALKERSSDNSLSLKAADLKSKIDKLAACRGD